VTGRDDASFVSQSAPLALQTGATAPVTITMRNTGGTVWTATEGYGLSPVGPPWGNATIPVPQDVRMQETATFSFTITAPASVGSNPFEWRMVNGAGVVFGESNEDAAIVVTAPGEPAACAGLRDRIAAIGTEIERIEALMTGDPRADAPRQRTITALTLERDNTTRTATTLGCTVQV
jgi:hypothetical protein